MFGGMKRLIRCSRYFGTSFYDFKLPEGVSPEIPEQRTVGESFVETILPFSTDENLKAEYLSFRNHIRIGKLLENMDLTAGQVAYLHADPFRKDTIMVTAACDRITLQNDVIHPEYDITVRGFPTYVGRSSMEIRVELIQQKTGAKLAGYFLFAARKASDFSSKPLPKLILHTPEEKEIAEAAVKRKEELRRDKKRFDILCLPTPEEREIIHQLFLKRKEGEPPKPLKRTRFDSTIFMHPREQNIHGHIFGGYIMRKAFEIAFVTACTFSHTDCVLFLVMDEIEFIAPVKIGQILNCSAIVTYTDPEEKLIQVAVEAHVVSPIDRSKVLTNTFQYTFKAETDSLDTLNPVTYEECMKYISGRRIMENACANRIIC